MHELEALKNALLPEDGASQREILGLVGWVGEQLWLLAEIRVSKSNSNNN